MKKVLMIAYYFPPIGSGGVIRTLKFAKYLPKYRWEPQILTVKAHYYESYMPKDFTLLDEVPAQLEVYRTSMARLLKFLLIIRRKFKKLVNFKEKTTLKDYMGNRGNKNLIQRFKDAITGFLSMPDEQIGWLPFGFFMGRKIVKEKNIDIIYSTAPPWTAHLIGYLLKKITKRPWVTEFRDPWTQDIFYEGRNYTRIRKIIEQFLEKQILRFADRVICVSETMKNNLINKYPFVDKKIEVITNGFDGDEFRNNKPKDKVSEKFTISYIGTLYHGRNPRSFLLALAQVISLREEIRQNIRVQFVGVIEREEKDRQLIIDLGLEGIVKIIGYVSRKEALGYLKSSDVLLLIIGKQKGSEYILTGKIFEYLSAKKPILALVPEGEAANLIRETKTGVIVDPENTEEIKKSIMNLYLKYIQGCLKIDSDINKIEKFDREKLTGNLAKIMEGCLKQEY